MKNGTAAHSDTPAENGAIRVLLVEDSAADARLMQEFLEGTPAYQFQIFHVVRLHQALQKLETNRYDAILLDLTLPDSDGLESLARLLAAVRSVPIVVLTNMNNPELAVEAVRRGAQDYLVKRQLTQELLVRSLRYAIERKQQAEALHQANNALEARVQARTADLETANRQLKKEISQRKDIQERFVLAQKVAKIAIFEWNIPSRQLTWSDESKILYGLSIGPSSGSVDNSYESWIKLLHEGDRADVEHALMQTVSSGKGLNIEFRISHPKGVRWLAVKSSLFTDADNQPLKLLGIQIDITDKKQLEAQFLQAQRLESLGTLASGIAHDLNNILTPILGVGQLLPLTLKHVDERSAELIAMINLSAQRGTKLVQQILSFARRSEVAKQVISIETLLCELEPMVAQTLPRAIEIETAIANNLWPIRGDETQLHQVFMNLCVNARDAMPNGGTLRLSARNIAIDDAYLQMNADANLGNHVVVTVKDTGTGISSKVMQRIFEPFFTTKEAGKGTGLGLAAVMNIVKSHEGFITVKTAPEQGTQFQVFLPVDSNTADETPSGDELPHGQQELILVVDDEPAVCQVLTAVLETYGYQVLVAHDGLEAIALLAEHRGQLQCALVDLIMPELDGHTTIPLLRRLQPALNIVAMTGSVAAIDNSTVRNTKLQGYLTKPFTNQELLTLLQTVLRSA